MRFQVSATFEVFGIGTIAVGEVKAGILRAGSVLRVEREGSLIVPPLSAQVVKMMVHVAHRVELYEGQYAKALDELGPGYQGGIQLKGVRKKDLRAGDVLVG